MRLRVGDVRLFVDVDGMGLVPDGDEMRVRPTIVTLHGGPGFDHSRMKTLNSGLVDIAQIIYFDYRGHGRSDRSTPDRWNLATWVDDLSGLLDTLGIERPILLGASYGAMLGLAFAARYPDRLSRLIVISPLTRMRLDLSLPIFERLGGAEGREVAARFAADPTPQNMADYMRVCLPLYTRTPVPGAVLRRSRINAELIEHFNRQEARTLDVGPELAAIRCPTLIMVGADDPITPAAIGAEIAALLAPGIARLRVFDGAGHPPTHDQPERALAEIRSFVLEQGTGQGPLSERAQGAPGQVLT